MIAQMRPIVKFEQAMPNTIRCKKRSISPP